MRRVVRTLKIAALTGTLAMSGAVAYLYARRPAMAPPANIQVAATPERLARGKYLFNLADCDGCHSQRDFSRFDGPVVAGRRRVGSVFPAEMGLPGLVAPPNITPDPETGIGAWTDGEKIRAIREGIDRDGHALFPMIPYKRFRNLSDEDIYSLVAYLDSLPPVNHRVPKTSLKFLDCHTGRFAGGEVFRVAPGVQVVCANISPDPETGIGRWSEQDFLDRLYQYREYAEHGSPKVGPESFTLMPWLNFTQLPPDDLKTIYTYMHSRKPVYKSIDTHPGYGPAPVRHVAPLSKASR